MKHAVGLPNWHPGTSGHALTTYARKAEALGFSSLGTIGRMVFDSHEELVALAACAAVTERIGLASTVLIAPVRETVLLAKQAATLDQLSGGRLTLGLGVGWRDDDFKATGNGKVFEKRGSVFARQLEKLREVWNGGQVGPAPARRGGPEVLVGAYTPAALARAGRLADGLIAVSAPVDVTASHYAAVSEAWKVAGRAGKPRLVAARYFVLGDDARSRAEANMRAYYSFGGDIMVKTVLDALVTSEKAAREQRDALAAIGVDEVFFWPASSDLEQLDRLAHALG